MPAVIFALYILLFISFKSTTERISRSYGGNLPGPDNRGRERSSINGVISEGGKIQRERVRERGWGRKCGDCGVSEKETIKNPLI